MSPPADADRLIFGLLAQLSQDQNREYPLDELDERFDAVMKALGKFHQLGRVLDLPELLCDSCSGYQQVIRVMHESMVKGLLGVQNGHFKLAMSSPQIYYYLHCFDTDELSVLRYLSVVFANPALADHDVQ